MNEVLKGITIGGAGGAVAGITVWLLSTVTKADISPIRTISS